MDLELRGHCKELAEEAVANDPTLTLRKGWYHCPIWGKEQHWWTERADGTVYDPSAKQYPSAGLGYYEVYEGFLDCEECGRRIHEDYAYFNSRFGFCDSECFGRYVGLGS